MGSLRRPPVFYGWVIVGVAFLTLAVAFGVRLSFGVFFVALHEEFGWTRAQTSSIFAASMIVFALTAGPIGAALDRWGARVVFTAGTVVLCLGTFLASLSSSLFGLVMAYGVVAGLGITVLGLGPQAGSLSRWFVERRGAAIGLAFAGTGLGTLLLTPAVERLIALFDWRQAYVALALLAALLVPLCAIFLRSGPEAVGQRPDGRPAGAGGLPRAGSGWTLRLAAQTPAFWVLILAALGAIGPLRMLTLHQVQALVDAGVPRATAAAVAGAEGAITALAFPLAGALSDRIGRERAYFLGAVCLAAAIFTLMQLRPPVAGWALLLYPLLMGLGEGSRSSLVTAMASDTFPGRSLGAINGFMGAAFGVGAAFFSWLAGRVYDVAGSYELAFWLGMVTVGISALCLWLAGRPGLRRELPSA